VSLHFTFFEQEQKAHEAIFRVLNLEGVAKEPALEEWSLMAKMTDKLHVPVCSWSYRDISGLVYITGFQLVTDFIMF
jgi:hypothetical protein